MGQLRRRAGLSAFVLLLGLGVAGAGGGEENALPATPAEALERARPAIEAARKAKPAETPEIVKGIRRAVELMQPHVKAGAADDAWAAAWNEALTLSRFHGQKPAGQYVLEPMQQDTLDQIELARREDSKSRHLGGCVLFGLPRGRGWTYTPKRPGDDEQCWGEIRRMIGRKRVAALIEISAYRFDVLYSEVGGENAVALAEGHLGYFAEKMAKVSSKSARVTARPLSKHFARCHHFEISGTTMRSENVRVRSYFVKGPTRTYAFDVTEYRDTEPTDPPFVVWQSTVDDPELDAVLASFDEGEVEVPALPGGKR